VIPRQAPASSREAPVFIRLAIFPPSLAHQDGIRQTPAAVHGDRIIDIAAVVPHDRGIAAVQIAGFHSLVVLEDLQHVLILGSPGGRTAAVDDQQQEGAVRLHADGRARIEHVQIRGRNIDVPAFVDEGRPEGDGFFDAHGQQFGCAGGGGDQLVVCGEGDDGGGAVLDNPAAADDDAGRDAAVAVAAVVDKTAAVDAGDGIELADEFGQIGTGGAGAHAGIQSDERIAGIAEDHHVAFEGAAVDMLDLNAVAVGICIDRGCCNNILRTVAGDGRCRRGADFCELVIRIEVPDGLVGQRVLRKACRQLAAEGGMGSAGIFHLQIGPAGKQQSDKDAHNTEKNGEPDGDAVLSCFISHDGFPL